MIDRYFRESSDDSSRALIPVSETREEKKETKKTQTRRRKEAANG